MQGRGSAGQSIAGEGGEGDKLTQSPSLPLLCSSFPPFLPPCLSPSLPHKCKSLNNGEAVAPLRGEGSQL